MISLSEFVSDAFRAFVIRSLANLGEDFSTPKKQYDSANHNHEKPPVPLGMLLMLVGIVLTGVCTTTLFGAVSVVRTLRFQCLADRGAELVLFPRRRAHQDNGFLPQPGRYGGENIIKAFRPGRVLMIHRSYPNRESGS